jgi:hypothetical protein
MKTQMTVIRPDHRLHALLASAARVFTSILGAGVFNFIWLSAFLTFSGKPPRGPVSVLLWFLAPPVTALGFAFGIILFDFLKSKTKDSFLSVFPLPLIGCVIGAAAIFPFAPMFIGFGMFVFGGFSVLIREVRLSRN